MFGLRLKELREKGGFTSQNAFAKTFGVAQSTVGNWEAGTREPNLGTLIKIADFFNVTTDYLLGRTDIPTGYVLQNEKLPTELVDSGVESITRVGGPDLSEREIEALRKMLAERPDLR